jgi:hypothetical protein
MWLVGKSFAHLGLAVAPVLIATTLCHPPLGFLLTPFRPH